MTTYDYLLTRPGMALNESTDDEAITKDDAAWILTNAFLILTMQSGFGLLEAGSVSFKNIANIMIKNVVDVTFGGISYWALGYGISFGTPSTPFFGYGTFFVTANDTRSMGTLYTHYVFQFSFATAATTIVSGAVAERMKLTSYMAFSVINTFVYCFPACWAWSARGFLKQLGFFDFAGGCIVHVTGGASALVATMMLGPRLGRFQKNGESEYRMSSPVTCLTGTFMLWWAWLGFNCGSTFGLSNGLWKVGAKVGVVTLNGSIAGGITGLITSYFVFNKQFDITYIITAILSGLVGVTAGCAVMTPFEGLVVGAIAAGVALSTTELLHKLKIDDPVGAVPVHFFSATWGTIAVGLFAKDEMSLLAGRNGLFRSGGFQLLGIQLVGWACTVVWSMLCTALCFYGLRHIGCLRVDVRDEILGADWVEHKVRSHTFAARLEKALTELSVADDSVDNVIKMVMRELTLEKGELSEQDTPEAPGMVGALFANNRNYPTKRRATLVLADVAQRAHEQLHHRNSKLAMHAVNGQANGAFVAAEEAASPIDVEQPVVDKASLKTPGRPDTPSSIANTAMYYRTYIKPKLKQTEEQGQKTKKSVRF